MVAGLSFGQQSGPQGGRRRRIIYASLETLKSERSEFEQWHPALCQNAMKAGVDSECVPWQQSICLQNANQSTFTSELSESFLLGGVFSVNKRNDFSQFHS